MLLLEDLFKFIFWMKIKLLLMPKESERNLENIKFETDDWLAQYLLYHANLTGRIGYLRIRCQVIILVMGLSWGNYNKTETHNAIWHKKIVIVTKYLALIHKLEPRMFPYDSNPNRNFDFYNRRPWYPPQNSYVGNANLYQQHSQVYWNFDYPRSSINNYYNNNNNFNRRRNHYRGSYSNRQAFRSTERVISNLTISPSITKEADVSERLSPDKRESVKDTEPTENIVEKNTTIPLEISYNDINNVEVDMEIDSDVDTVILPDTSPNENKAKSVANKSKSDSTKEVIIEEASKIAKKKKNKRRRSTADREIYPVLPAKRKERSASIPRNYLSLLNPSSDPTVIVTRSKSRENLCLEEEMLSCKKKIVTNEKNSEMCAEQPKSIADKLAKKTIRRSSMFATKSNAETNSQLLNRDPRLQNRKDLKYKIVSNNGEALMSTIGPNTNSTKAPTQKDPEQGNLKMRMQQIFGKEDSNSPPKHSQTETVQSTSKEKEKKKDKYSKRKRESQSHEKPKTKVKSETTKRHKSAEHRKYDKSLVEKKISKNMNTSTDAEVEQMEEEVVTDIPEFELVPKTAQPLIHGKLISPNRITETSLQLCDDQVGVIDIDTLPDISENSLTEDLLMKTEKLVEEFDCGTYPSSDNSVVTEDSDIFEYLRESDRKHNEITTNDQNLDFGNERISDISQLTIAAVETVITSPLLLHTPMELQDIKFIPPESDDVKPVLPKEAIILIEDEDPVQELIKIDYSDFANMFARDFHCYHIVENTVYELSVNTATTPESKSNYLELFNSRTQIFDRISRTMYAYFQKYEILNFNCNNLIEEINQTYKKRCNSEITNLKILRFLHNVVLTWRKPENDFMKRFCDDIGHYMLLSNMEIDHDKNQPPKSIISSTSEAVVTKDSTFPSQTVAVAAQTTVEQNQQVEPTLNAKQTITISTRPIEQLLAKPHLSERTLVEEPISSQTQPSVNNNLGSPRLQHSHGASYQITLPQSTTRTAESLPPSYQSTYEDQQSVTRNSMQPPLNKTPPVLPTSSQTQSSSIAKPKSRPAKKVANKSQNQFTQSPQNLSQPPPYSTNLNLIENLYRNMTPAQNKHIPSPTYHSRFQPIQNLPDTHSLGIAEVPTSQATLWSLQHMANTAQARLPQSKQFQNNSSLHTYHPRYAPPTVLPAHLMQSRPQAVTKSSTQGSQFHEHVQTTSSANSNTYYPNYSMYQEHTENQPHQQFQYEVAPRAATTLAENSSNDNLYFHGHEMENHNTRLQTAQLQHQVAVQPSLLVEQLGRPLRNSPQGYSRPIEVSNAQLRISHSNGTFNSIRSPLNLSSQFAPPHLSASPRISSQSTSQYGHGQQFQGLIGQAQQVQKLPSQQRNRRSSSGSHSSLNQILHPISSRVAECTSTSRTPDIESNIPPSVGNSYTTVNNTVVNTEPVITTVVVKTEIVPRQIDTYECIVIDDDNDDNISSHSEDQSLSSPTITSSLNTTQTQDNSIINLSKICICNEEAIFICVCKKALYCSIECQKKDWDKHSSVCI